MYGCRWGRKGPERFGLFPRQDARGEVVKQLFKGEEAPESIGSFSGAWPKK